MSCSITDSRNSYVYITGGVIYIEAFHLVLIRPINISLKLLNAYIQNAYNTIRLNSKRPKHYPLNDKRTYKFRLLQKTSFVKGLVTDKIDKSHSDN